MNSKLTQSVIYVSLTREHPAEFYARRGMIFACTALLMVYVYFASASVFHAVAARSVASVSENERTELAHLEKEYFTLSKNIDMRRAGEFGLVKASDKHFVSRTVHVGLATY
ncbi:MAG: hypothetical protein HYT30_00270 [Parcubacteria group bacterium]|nr:hypothetical protein [Parcubacteria group bacterium]